MLCIAFARRRGQGFGEESASKSSDKAASDGKVTNAMVKQTPARLPPVYPGK